MTFGKRRGAYVEPFLSREYLANGGGMVTDLTGGLMHYWLATKDKSAAVAVVALASAVLAENSGGPHAMPCYWKREAGSTVLLPPGQGERGTVGVTHYSGSPFQKNWAPEYVHMVCPAFVYAYDLTGKHEFLEAARGGYAEAARTNYLGNMPCYWDAPVLLYYLETFEPQ
jgi:hypothetical protein